MASPTETPQGFDVQGALQSGASEDQVYDYLKRTTPGFDFAAAEKQPGVSKRQIIDYMAQHPKGERPQFAPGPMQPSPNFPQGHLTGKDMLAAGVNALPMVGGMIGGMVGGAGGGMVGGIPGAAVGASAGEGVKSAIVSKVGQEKLSGPTLQVDPPPGSGKDLAIGMAKAGAEQGAFELGGNLAGKLLRGSIGGPLHAGTKSYENALVKEASEKYGLKLTAQEITNSAKMSQRLGEYSILSQGFIRRKWGEGAANGIKAIDEVLGRLYPPTSPAESATAVRGMFKLSRDIFQRQAQEIYQNQLKPVAAQVPINMRPVKRAAADMLADIARDKTAYGELGGMGAKTEKLLNNIVGSPDDVPFEVVHDMRSNLMQITPAPEELMAGKVQAISKKLLSETTEAMDVSLSAANPQVRQLWEEARDFYKTGAEIFDHEAIQGMMSRDPVGLVKSIKPGDADMAERVREAILKYPQAYGNPAEKQQADLTWRQFQEQFARTNILQDAEHVGLNPDPESLANISEQIKKIGPGVLNEIYGSSSGGRSALLNLKDIGTAFSRVQKLPAEGRKYVYDILAMIGSIPGIYEHSAGAVAGSVVGFEAIPLIISAGVHSKTGTGYLLDGIGGIIKAFENRPMKSLGKGLIRLQEKTITSDPSYKYLGKAMADFARAAEVYRVDRAKIDRSRAKHGISDSPGVPGAGRQQDAIHLMLNEWR